MSYGLTEAEEIALEGGNCPNCGSALETKTTDEGEDLEVCPFCGAEWD